MRFSGIAPARWDGAGQAAWPPPPACSPIGLWSTETPSPGQLSHLPSRDYTSLFALASQEPAPSPRVERTVLHSWDSPEQWDHWTGPFLHDTGKVWQGQSHPSTPLAGTAMGQRGTPCPIHQGSTCQLARALIEAHTALPGCRSKESPSSHCSQPHQLAACALNHFHIVGN